MKLPTAFWCALLAALLACGSAPPTYAEDDEPEAEEEEEEEGPEEGAPISDTEAKALAKQLGKLAKKRKAGDILPTMEKVGLRSHPALHKPLLKLMLHAHTRVAVRALEILRVQQLEKEKDKKKLAKLIWKNGWLHPKNAKRYTVKGQALLAYVKQRPGPLDRKMQKEVEKLWKWCFGNPNKEWGACLNSICEYVSETEDKRFCRLLAENIEQLECTDPNSGTNPPEEWWKRRWELWKETKAACIETLDDLTGETFKTVKAAQEWFEANEKEFGFVW